MYITAHRVRPVGRADTHGINAFLHRHGGDSSLDWDNPDIRQVAETKTGTLVDKIIEVKPGMNRVLSYLDVVTADDRTPHVAGALDAFESLISVNLPLAKVINGVGIRFDAQAGLPVEELVEEYRSLKNRILELTSKVG